jgi:hypothetical protein
MFNARYSDVYQRPEEKFAFPWFTKVDGFSPAPPLIPPISPIIRKGRIVLKHNNYLML